MIKKILKEKIRTLKLVKTKIQNAFETPTIALLYHRVTSLEHDSHMLSVTPEIFRQQIKFLKDNYEIITPNELGVRKGVIITFDDGYLDNLLEAVPILEEFNVKASFFISTGNIGEKREFWWDEVESIFERGGGYRGDLCFENIKLKISSLEDFSLFSASIHPSLKRMSHIDREHFINYLSRELQVPRIYRKSHAILNKDELVEFSKYKTVIIGAHTQTHPALSSLSKLEQENEILGSKKYLEDSLKMSINTFSYPFGNTEDYNKNAVEIASKNFNLSFANYPGLIYSWTPRHELPRHIVRNWALEEFAFNFKKFGM